MCNIIDRRIVKTRKPHRCFGCHSTIPASANAERSTNVDDGRIYNIYLCEDCMEFSKTLPDGYWEADGCYFEGDLTTAKQVEGWKANVV